MLQFFSAPGHGLDGKKKSSQVKVLIWSKSDRPPGTFGCNHFYSIFKSLPGREKHCPWKDISVEYVQYMCIYQMHFVPDTNGTATVLTVVAAC